MTHGGYQVNIGLLCYAKSDILETISKNWNEDIFFHCDQASETIQVDITVMSPLFKIFVRISFLNDLQTSGLTLLVGGIAKLVNMDHEPL